MVGYSNAQLNQIYTYIGFNAYVTFEPQIKSAITSTQATADGGSQPDGTLQTQVLQLCSNLSSIDQQLLNLQPLFFISKSSTGATISPQIGDFMLRRQGRALIGQLCTIFGLSKVRQDYYSKAKVGSGVDDGMSHFPSDF